MRCGKILCFVISSAMFYSRLIHIKSFIIPSLYASFVAFISLISLRSAVHWFLITHKSSFCGGWVPENYIKECFAVLDYLDFKLPLKDISKVMFYDNGSIIFNSHFKCFGA